MAQGLEGIKGALGEGARANKYKVTITRLASDDSVSTLAKAASLPGYSIGVVEVYSQGRKVPLAGDAAYDTWDVTFYNSKDMKIVTAMNDWMKSIDDYAGNASENPALIDYTGDIVVEQLDRNGTTQKTFTLKNAWPTTVAAVDLGADSADTITEVACTFAYSHYEIS